MIHQEYTESPTILVLDGNEQNAELLRQFLVNEGYDPSVFTNLDEAETVLTSFSEFAFAIIDIDRFDSPIWEFCEQLHDNEVPFFVLSGIRKRSLRRESREYGARSYVTKPVPQEEFLTLINNAINVNS